jgi:hypothetical protein
MTTFCWQPIETAPKDGQSVDLWWDKQRLTRCWWRIPTNPAHDWPRGKEAWCRYHYGWGEWVEVDRHDRTSPTHWMRVTGPS